MVSDELEFLGAEKMSNLYERASVAENLSLDENMDMSS